MKRLLPVLALMASAPIAHAQPVPTRAGGLSAPGANPAWTIDQFGNATFASLDQAATVGNSGPTLAAVAQQANSAASTLASPLTIGVLPPLPTGSLHIGSVGIDNTVATADPNNAAFHGSTVLTPSGTLGTAGTIGNTGTVLTAAAAGYSFAWVCTRAGTGSITLPDGSVLPYYFSANGGGMQHDGLAIVDAEPGAATGCTFWNLH